jgi:hypothetical protein
VFRFALILGLPGASLASGLTCGRVFLYFGGMAAVDDLRALGAPVGDAALTAGFIAQLNMGDQQKARLLRDYLRESGVVLSRAILVAARDYSFYL